MFINRIFYTLKPLIPRSTQIYLRRRVANYKRKKYAHIWPINPDTANPPEGWKGWPDGKKFALVLSHDVDTRKGYENCFKLADLEERMGFRSSFNFVPELYGKVSLSLLDELRQRGFDVAVHGLKHDGKLFRSRHIFSRRAVKINAYLREWQTRGFTSPSMHHNLDWLSALNIDYAISTFDTDPFEPQPDAAETIFPFLVQRNSERLNASQPSCPAKFFRRKTNEVDLTGASLQASEPPSAFIELPYTLPQDSTLFIIFQEKTIEIWKQKLGWIAEKGGMALVNVHPDYINFNNKETGDLEYPAKYYADFLEYVNEKYEGAYWHSLPRDTARFWEEHNEYRKKSVSSVTDLSHKEKKRGAVVNTNGEKVWIDLDNSPHVPFFSPIIEELEQRGYQIFITARDCAQTCGLADLYNLRYKRIGRHYGKQKILKVAGTVFRAIQLMSVARNERPILAVSHGSRAQMLSAWMSGIPSVVIMDYEHVRGFLHPTWLMMPEVINADKVKHDPKRIIKYPGIKEDVYIKRFKPDPGILKELGLKENHLIVTIRPPATEAHYHNPEGERLFLASVDLLGLRDNVRMVILPRNDRQKSFIYKKWPQWCENRKIIVPDHVVDGLNLLWHSDVAISGGGTMNREAAAMGVPVYSIFRGKIGTVDEYLSAEGRLVLVKSISDIKNKIKLEFRDKHNSISINGNPSSALKTIVKHLSQIVELR